MFDNLLDDKQGLYLQSIQRSLLIRGADEDDSDRARVVPRRPVYPLIDLQQRQRVQELEHGKLESFHE